MRGFLCALRLIACLLIGACAQDTPRTVGAKELDSLTVIDHAKLKPSPLAKVWTADTKNFGRPSSLAVAGSHVIVIDRAGTGGFLITLGAANGEVETTWGRKGQGPGEFTTPWRITSKGDTSSLIWVYDLTLRRVTSFNVDAVIDGLSEPQSSPTILTDRAVLHSIGIINDTWLAGTGVASSDSQVALYDRNGLLVRQTGQLPGDKDLEPRYRSESYEGTVAVSADGSMVAVARKYAGRVDIYNLDGESSVVTDVPFAFSPSFVLERTSRTARYVQGDHVRFGYIDLTSDGTFIYALFSGRTRSRDGGRVHLATEIHVFDWKGRFIRALRLDEDAIALAVSAKHGLIYTALARLDGEPTIAAYRLPPPPN